MVWIAIRLLLGGLHAPGSFYGFVTVKRWSCQVGKARDNDVLWQSCTLTIPP